MPVTMRLHTLKPNAGSKKDARRVGRGIGSGLGKTCGRGHKGLLSRSGGKVKPGFEGGQMPLHRRVPKSGFSSRKAIHTEQITLSELTKVEDGVIDLMALKKANIIKHDTKTVKIIYSGKVSKSVVVEGLRITKGARQAIIEAGGKLK